MKAPASLPVTDMWTLIEPDQPDSKAELTAVPQKSASPWRLIGYATVSLALAAGLLAQVGIRHLDSISQHDTLRPWLLRACEIADCVLPTRQDSRLIVSNQLSIDPHPDYQGISQMALRFTNNAGFSQSLPTLELVFSDIHGQPVAGRRFSPRQYLDQSPATPVVMAMSAQQSLNVRLEFATPADDAVNYQVRFFHE